MATSREWAQVIVQTWLDEEFKSLLEKDPVAALKQHGIETDAVWPVPPRPDELKDEQLEVILGNKVSFFKCFMNSGSSEVAGSFFEADTKLKKDAVVVNENQ